jgi:hypothetical protein
MSVYIATYAETKFAKTDGSKNGDGVTQKVDSRSETYNWLTIMMEPYSQIVCRYIRSDDEQSRDRSSEALVRLKLSHVNQN